MYKYNTTNCKLLNTSVIMAFFWDCSTNSILVHYVPENFNPNRSVFLYIDLWNMSRIFTNPRPKTEHTKKAQIYFPGSIRIGKCVCMCLIWYIMLILCEKKKIPLCDLSCVCYTLYIVCHYIHTYTEYNNTPGIESHHWNVFFLGLCD
jgi:hypothetical protein